MTFLHNISTVAHYEARTLSRSWFFRLFMIGSLFIFTFMNIGLFSPIGDEQWNMVSIPASVPLVNLYLLNIGQAIVVIFLAADFLKRDKKVDTNEVLYTRSMSNFEYIIGKTWGILRLFLTLDLVILGIAMIVNLISKQMKIDFIAYLQYLLIISVPTIIFSLGLAFMLMSIIRNQALTFLVLLGYAALDMFWLYYRAGSVFDYMAFGLPLYKSGILGFDNFSLILNQRLMYLFAGLALVMSTILIFKRLPQSKPHMVLSSVLLVAFTAGAAFCTFNTIQFYNSAKVTKNDVIRINRQYESVSFPSLTDARLEVEHTADGIAVKAFLKIFNDTEKPLDEYCFSLNPGLKVNRITRSGKETGFRNDGHIIIATPGIQLPAGETDSLEVDYSGTITEAFCYPNFDDNIKDYPYRIAMVNVRKRQAFLTGDYALLTPETHWYPTFGLNYYPSNPARIKVDFTRFTLNVKTREDLVAVSQGLPGKNNDVQVYKPGTPLTGLTLAIGNYIADTMKVGKIEYLAWHYPGNDYYKKDLSELKDTIKLLVSGIMTELETNFSTKYPFSTLSLVEAPIQYYSYPRQNTQTRSEVQPSMVIIPEKLSTMENAGFAKRFMRQKKNMQRNNQVITPKELQVRIFNNFVRNAFISGENFRFRNGVAMNEPTRYRLGPSFYFFINNFFSESYPVINAAFESHLQKVNTPGRQGGQMMFFGESLSENDKANLIMRDKSFRDIMAMNPGDDTVRTILTVKGDVFFNLLRKHAGIDQFSTWFHSYLDTNKFRRVNITTFDKDFNK
ncbi:MAG: ABC transporter permease, partial [Bacteroidales bacterium]